MTDLTHWLSGLASRPASLECLAPPQGLRLAVIGPHPDDFDAMGVTLRFFHDRGHTIRAVVCHTSSGVQDTFCTPPTPAIKQALREQEQRDSLRFFGLPDTAVVFLDLERDPSGNDQPFDCAANQTQLASVLLPFHPDLVFLPHGHDTNDGHRKIYAMVSRMLRTSELPVVAWLVRDPKTVALRTDIYLPFDDSMARWKAELLRFHRSQQQRNLNTRGHGFDARILGLNRQISRELGLTQPYAEAFELEFFGAA
jgi:LmbE family N-acetylglucosaminyl deacetylase